MAHALWQVRGHFDIDTDPVIKWLSRTKYIKICDTRLLHNTIWHNLFRLSITRHTYMLSLAGDF